MVGLTKKKISSLLTEYGVQARDLEGRNRARKSHHILNTMMMVPDPYDYFKKAFKTELEHGIVGGLTNVTDDDIDNTAKIVFAHLKGVEYGKSSKKWKFFPAYYDYLWAVEENGPK